MDRVAGRLLAVDTMVFIHYLDGHPRYGPMLAPLFEGWETGTERAVASALGVAETLVGPLRAGAGEDAGRAVQWLRSMPGLKIVPVSVEVGVRAAEIRAQHGLAMADSIHASTADLERAEIFLTNDRGFARLPALSPLLLDDLT